MKVILKQDVKKLGKAGDIVEVSEGYGRNFLLPRKAAVEATAQNLNLVQKSLLMILTKHDSTLTKRTLAIPILIRKTYLLRSST